MEICYLCIMRMLVILFYVIMLMVPFVFSTLQLTNRWHPHHSNASDQEAVLGFMSAIAAYDPSQSLPTNWKPNVSVCEWTGITCSRRTQRVVTLDVGSMGLEGFEDSTFTSMKGSTGYIPPEYGLGICATTKGDVYSYGIVLLEMLTKKRPTHNMFVEGLNLQKWVSNSFPNRVEEVLDSSLLKRISSTPCSTKEEEFHCLNQLIHLGLLCTKDSPRGRPNMMDVVKTLQNIKDRLF